MALTIKEIGVMLARLIGRRPKSFSLKGRPKDMPGFDREFYLADNPDVAAKGVDPLEHYLEYGWREGREPSAGFTGQRYLALNPDVRAGGLNPLVHYLKHGLAEGRPGAWGETVSPDRDSNLPPAEATSEETLQVAVAPRPSDHPPRQPTRLL